MRRWLYALLATLLATLLISCGSREQKSQEPIEDGVWICTGAYATKYHCDRDCEGLNMCGRRIEMVSLKKAKAQGRTECRWCYE